MDCSIPKKIFMVWLGDRVPSYASFSARAFQQVNPDFELVFIHRTVQDLEDIWNGKLADPPLKRALSRVLQENEDSYVKWQREFYGGAVRFLQLLADVARVEILNQYGGIYVDCDTFPIVPFDDSLLSHHFFCVKRKSGVGTNSFLDNFFLGKSSSSRIVEDPYHIEGSFLVDHTKRCETIPQYYLLKRKFFAGQLEIGEHVLSASCYVDHYCSRTWKQNSLANQRERWFDRVWRR